MREKPDDTPKIPKRLKEWASGVRHKGGTWWNKFVQSSAVSKVKDKLTRGRSSSRATRFEFDPKKIEWKKVAEKSEWFRWGLIVLAVFLLADIVARMMGVLIRPAYTPLPHRQSSAPQVENQVLGDSDAILKRNMFNVEGKIPDPFDQGLLDCLSQAKPSTQKLMLLGTIVMNDERFSVALVQEEGNPTKHAVKKDEFFLDNKYQALKVDRRKFCFQVRSTSELEYIEIPDDSIALGVSPSLSGGGSDNIVPVNDKSFEVKKAYLDEKLLNLNEILQTARAVPHIEGGKFMGFLVQSVDPGSPFAQLGIKQGDILTNVNDINLDNAGKGLEAFQKLRSSRSISIGIIRGGEKTSLSYAVK